MLPFVSHVVHTFSIWWSDHTSTLWPAFLSSGNDGGDQIQVRRVRRHEEVVIGHFASGHFGDFGSFRLCPHGLRER